MEGKTCSNKWLAQENVQSLSQNSSVAREKNWVSYGCALLLHDGKSSGLFWHLQGYLLERQLWVSLLFQIGTLCWSVPCFQLMYQDSAFFHYCVNVGRVILSSFVIHQNIVQFLQVQGFGNRVLFSSSPFQWIGLSISGPPDYQKLKFQHHYYHEFCGIQVGAGYQLQNCGDKREEKRGWGVWHA